MDDDDALPTAAEYRERSERARVQARTRYRDFLTDLLEQQGIEWTAAVAEAVLDALTEWRYVETGERCRCSCHPQLPDSDRHDYGFDCVCTRTRTERRESFQLALNDIRKYWQSPDGQRTEAANMVAEAGLQTWLSQHPGVVVHSHGGWVPEQWRGEVDGHSFYFRERHDDWHIEIDLHPTGQSIDAIDGRNSDGTTRYQQQDLQQGDIIATGTIYADGYGVTAVERAQFIVTTIRDHLRRTACTHHPGKLGSIEAVLGRGVRWCPDCGTRLGAR